MALDTIKQTWDESFIGEMETPTGKVFLGEQENGIYPYHMLFGALGSCFYATFLSVAKKKRLSFDKAELEVSGNKGEGKEINLLEKVTIKLVITNPSNEIGLKKSAELGSKFCSIHETISKVADIDLIVEFIKA
ncbi:MAG: OsmC family protein [Tenericutes bacterium]|nr:OsmC family protein [Mycoplasmatota bacterium]